MAKAKDTSNTNDNAISDSLANEARELGIEPASYSNAQDLQERVEHVRAERDAVSKGQPDLQAEAADEQAAANDGVMTTENTPSDNDNK